MNEFTKYVVCPKPYPFGSINLPNYGLLQGVWCKQDEEIKWIWSNDIIIGYNIIKVKPN